MLEHALRSLQIKLRNLRTKQYPYSKGRLPKNISILLLIISFYLQSLTANCAQTDRHVFIWDEITCIFDDEYIAHNAFLKILF